MATLTVIICLKRETTATRTIRKENKLSYLPNSSTKKQITTR
ncbi:hypothetical protein DOY81_004079 [Sarcophaga bullata]|nr:hypothetical protein DOY81_004079 [Sarcophaga bullata]